MAPNNQLPDDGVRIEALEEEVADLAYTVQTLAATTARLAGSGDLPDDGTESAGWDRPEELVRWVHWLVTCYELHDIPECWAHHGRIIGELDALRVAWLDTIGKGQGGLAAMQWHDYAARTFERLSRYGRSCADGTHRPTNPARWATGDPAEVDQPDLVNRYKPLPLAGAADPPSDASGRAN